MEVIITGHDLKGAYGMTRPLSFRASVSTITLNAGCFFFFLGGGGKSWPIFPRGYALLDRRTPRTLGGRYEVRTNERSSFVGFF